MSIVTVDGVAGTMRKGQQISIVVFRNSRFPVVRQKRGLVESSNSLDEACDQ